MNEIISVTVFTAAVFCAIMLNLAARPRVAKGFIGTAICLTAVGGLLMYSYGYACVTDSVALAVIRATFAVCRIFVGGNAFSDIEDAPAFQYTVFHIVFWLLHLMGLFGSTGAAIRSLGAGVLRRLRLWLVRRNDIAIVFGLSDNTVDFARRLQQTRDAALIFVDEHPNADLAGAVDQMGGIIRSDSDAVEATVRFLKGIGVRSGSRRVWLYALDQDTVANRQYAAALLKALQTRGAAPDQTALTIRGPEDETENSFQASPDRYGYGSVICVNEPEMVARLLVRTYPPCDSISFNNCGEAAEDFHALIIGFGQVGQAVLRQLVMNGQFQGSSFRAAVFAPNVEQVVGRLSHECGEMLNNYDITFHDQDGRSRQLYRYLTQHTGDLRYIAICTGSDTMNAEIAQELRSFLLRRGSRAAVYQCSHRGIRHQLSEDKIAQHGIYTPDILCSDRIDRMAMVLNQTYCGSGTMRENWEKCDYFSRMSSRASADFVPAMLRAAGVSAGQVLECWEPAGELLENLARTEHLRWCAFHYAMGFRAMTREEYESRAQRYLAEKEEKGTSRLRVGKDLANRLHACLIPWEELDELSRRENAITGGSVDYKEMDRSNVRSIQSVLHEMEER